ncbi:MAG: membrane dipeptidase [Parachlamydiales bacterium]|nr:membrane dipeptidase [Candidatus Acheromyda pituitae]
MEYPIIDLHCDLLTYLSMGKERTANDPISRSSIPQLKKGRVKLQTLAIYALTQKGSTWIGQEQLKLLKKLTERYIQDCALYTPETFASSLAPVQFIPAFENASGFSEESESLAQSLERLEQIHKEFKHILYIGMTWNGENRFGGGVGSQKGLKDDGKRLLEWMVAKQIAIDFSHTSDPLAEGILNHLDQENLKIPVLASHSNYRAITDEPRNMPDWLVQELVRRKGLMGINLLAAFIHKSDPSALVRHVEYALSLGAHDSLAFGADFFCDADFPDHLSKYQTKDAFFKEYANSECYPSILDLLATKLSLKEDQLQKIAHGNAERFLSGIFKS